MSRLEIAITTHHDLEIGPDLPGGRAYVKHWITQVMPNGDDSGFSIETEPDGSTVASVTVSILDEAARLFDSGRNDDLYRLFVRYIGQAMLWAPATTEWDAEAGTCTITAKDTDRLEKHFLRTGDTALAKSNGFGGKVPCDYRGLRLLRDAANNTTEQNARYVAPLGIRNGSSNTARTQRTRFQRGDQVLSAMQQIPGCHWRLVALDVNDEGAYPDYMELKVKNDLGVDRSTDADAVSYQYGYGLRNLDNFTAAPADFITHAHVLGDGGSPRFTRHQADSSRHRGVYVHWAATQHKLPFDGFGTTLTADITSGATTIDVAVAGAPRVYQAEDFVIQIGDERMLVTAGRTGSSWTVERGYDGTTAASHDEDDDVTHIGVLALMAEEIIEDYGLPAQNYTLTLKPDSVLQQTFFDWADPGDTILAGCKTGYLYIEAAMRVLKLTITATGRLKDTTATLDVAPVRVALTDITGGEQ